MQPSAPLPRHLERAFSVRDALESGVGYGRLRGDDLSRPFHGVREITPAADLLERCRSYAARMRPGEFFCAATAAALHGIPLPWRIESDPRLHVAVPNPRRGPRSRGVVGHKFIVQPARGELVTVEGLPLSSPERAWCEMGVVLELDELVAAGDHLIRPAVGLSSAGRLEATLRRFPDPRARPLLERAFALLDPGSESTPESKFRLILVLAGITGFRVNLSVRIPGTRTTRRIDLAFVAEKVAFEYQGDHHRDPRQWRDDMTRVAQLESLGWKVVFINADDLRDPAELVARVQRILAARR